jgi:hypothetical protein
MGLKRSESHSGQAELLVIRHLQLQQATYYVIYFLQEPSKSSHQLWRSHNDALLHFEQSPPV